MKRKYEICCSGCDDATSIDYELTELEYKLIKDICTQITNASTYERMPHMSIQLKSVEAKK